MTRASEILRKSTVKMKPIPTTLVKLAAIVADPHFRLEEAVDVISLDQVLASDVLRMANSASSASVRTIETVRDAVIRLGAGRILEWSVARRVSPLFATALPEYGLEENDLWRHSLASALAAEGIRKTAAAEGVLIPVAAYTAGLLHDIGKLILPEVLAPEVRREIGDLVRNGAAYIEAEGQVLGTTHAEVGAEVLKSWNLPAEIVTAVAMHHQPDELPDLITDAVHLANVTAKYLGIGLGAEGLALKASVEAARRLRIGQRQLERVALEVLDELGKYEALFTGGEGTEVPGEPEKGIAMPKGRAILVVDDSAVMRKMIIRTIRMGAFEVSEFLEASNGQEALDILRSRHIDIVLVDVNMPVMNGEEMLIAMRADPALAGIPAIVVSTEGSETRQARLKALKAEFIHKPFTPEQIVSVMTALLGGPQ